MGARQDVYDDEPACRVCGCTENAACSGGCWWVPDPEMAGELCSTCALELYGEDLAEALAVEAAGCPWCEDEGCVYCTMRPTELVVVRSAVL